MANALVLGGGGPLGIAWEAGLLHGLAQSGFDLSSFDPIIGTSAGSIVGAHLAVHGDVKALFAAQSQPIGPDTPPAPKIARFLAAYLKAKLVTSSITQLRASVGKSARAAGIPGERTWLNAIARYVPEGAWPAKELLVTAIDAGTGELRVWDRDAGIPIFVAVASSCAVPCAYPLVTIHGRMYMDGGIGSQTNAALAQGCSRVVILDPIGHIPGARGHSQNEARQLAASGSSVFRIVPDDATAHVIGMHLMDPSRRAQVAKLGQAQGIALDRADKLAILFP